MLINVFRNGLNAISIYLDICISIYVEMGFVTTCNPAD
jgi:hypothetical protein